MVNQRGSVNQNRIATHNPLPAMQPSNALHTLNPIRKDTPKRTRDRRRREENGDPLRNLGASIPEGEVECDARDQARFGDAQKYTRADWGRLWASVVYK